MRHQGYLWCLQVTQSPAPTARMLAAMIRIERHLLADKLGARHWPATGTPAATCSTYSWVTHDAYHCGWAQHRSERRQQLAGDAAKTPPAQPSSHGCTLPAPQDNLQAACAICIGTSSCWTPQLLSCCCWQHSNNSWAQHACSQRLSSRVGAICAQQGQHLNE